MELSSPKVLNRRGDETWSGFPNGTRGSETLQLSMPHLFHKKDVGEQMHIVEVDI